MAENITIIAYLKDVISRPAKQAAASLQLLEDEIDDLQHEFDAGRISMSKYKRQMAALTNEHKIMSRMTARHARTQTKFGRSIGAHERTLGKTKRRGLRGALGGVVGVLGQFGKGMLKAGKALIPSSRLAKMALGLTVLLPVITAVGGGLVAMAGSAAPMVGLLAAFPGLGLAAAAGLGVMIAAVSSLSEGIALLADPTATVEEINAFWADKTPEAKAFGVTVAGIIPIFTRIRDAIHTSLLPELGQALQDISDKYAPFFVTKLGDVGDALGRVAEYAAKVFTEVGFLRDMEAVWDSTTAVVERLGMAVIHVMSGLRGLMVAAIPLTERFGNAIHNAFSRFDVWANSEVGRNKMTEFFDDAWTTAESFFGALKDLGVALWNIMMIGKDLGDSLGGGMAEALQTFRDWTEGTPGQERIRKFFVDITETLAALGRLGKAVFSEMFETGAGEGQQNSAVDMIDGITAAVPGIFKVIDALITLAGWIGKVIVWVVTFFEWLGKIPGVGGILQWVVGLGLFLGRGKALMFILRLVGLALGFVFGGWVIALITGIVAGVALLYAKSETFRNMVHAVGNAIATFWGGLRERHIDPIIEGIQSLVEWIEKIDFSKITGNIGERIKDAPNRWMNRARGVFRKEGGPVMPGQTVTVGEAGREFLLSPSGVTMVGETGRQTMRMAEPGVVLSNPVTERILASAGTVTHEPSAAERVLLGRQVEGGPGTVERVPGATERIPGTVERIPGAATSGDAAESPVERTSLAERILVGKGPERGPGGAQAVAASPLTERILAGTGGRQAPEQAIPSVAPLAPAGGHQASSNEVPWTLPAVQVGPFYGSHPDEVREAVRSGIRQSREDAERKHGRRP